MIIRRKYSLDRFLDICSKVTYKDKDNEEVKHITNNRLSSVYELYEDMNHRWEEYYIIEYKGKVLCTIILTHNNYLHYFVTVDLVTHLTLPFVKKIKYLAKQTIRKRQVLFVRTSIWYKEAMKFNKLIGFKCNTINEDYEYSIWHLDKEGIK